MPFRILTWNINGTSQQNDGPDQLADVIHRHRIDMALVQEVSVNGCTLNAALTAQFGAGNYDLRYQFANPSLAQRTWTDPATLATSVAQPSAEERYAIILRQRANGTYRLAIQNIQALDYLNDVNVAAWVGERHATLRAAAPVMHPGKIRRLSRPPLVDPTRFHRLGLRRPIRIKATYHGHSYYIFCWHAPQGGGNGGANFSGRDAEPGYRLWRRAGGGSQYPKARVILAGDLNARHPGIAGLGENWAQALSPGANIHNDRVTHIYANGVVLNALTRPAITALAAHSDHVALAATVT
jgi:hypothetical protein